MRRYEQKIAKYRYIRPWESEAMQAELEEWHRLVMMHLVQPLMGEFEGLIKRGV